MTTAAVISNLGLETSGGKFIAMSISVTWFTVLMLIITGIYPAQIKTMLPLTFKAIFLFLLLAFSSRCVRIGGCQKYYNLIVLSSMSACVYLVISLP